MASEEKLTLHLAEAIAASDPLRDKEAVTVARTEDGDVVTLRATAPGTDGGRIGLGEVTGRILPAHT